MRAAGEIISWPVLMALTGNRMGVFDVPCPLCSHLRKPANRKKPVLRVWRDERPDFATYYCARCSAHGYVHSDSPFARRIDPKQSGTADAQGRQGPARAGQPEAPDGPTPLGRQRAYRWHPG